MHRISNQLGMAGLQVHTSPGSNRYISSVLHNVYCLACIPLAVALV